MTSSKLFSSAQIPIAIPPRRFQSSVHYCCAARQSADDIDCYDVFSNMIGNIIVGIVGQRIVCTVCCIDVHVELQRSTLVNSLIYLNTNSRSTGVFRLSSKFVGSVHVCFALYVVCLSLTTVIFCTV